jgi:hypothetical protein
MFPERKKKTSLFPRGSTDGWRWDCHKPLWAMLSTGYLSVIINNGGKYNTRGKRFSPASGFALVFFRFIPLGNRNLWLYNFPKFI